MTYEEAKMQIQAIPEKIWDRLSEPDREAMEMAFSALQAQEAKHSKESSPTHKALDTISRKVAIDAVDSETVSTNPENFKSSEKFIKFMDDADIASFGKWQWANGFNTALVATAIQLKKLPSAQPEIIRCKDFRWRKDQSGSTAWLPCRAIVTPSDFYCGRAERRTDG